MRHDYTDASGRRFLAEAEAQDTETFAADYARQRTDRVRGQRRTRGRIAVAVAILIVALIAAHVAPKAIGQYQHDAAAYQEMTHGTR